MGIRSREARMMAYGSPSKTKKSSGNGKSSSTQNDASRETPRHRTGTGDKSEKSTKSVSPHGTRKKTENASEQEHSQAEHDAQAKRDAQAEQKEIIHKIVASEKKLKKHQEIYDMKLKQYAIVDREANEMHHMPGVSAKGYHEYDLKKCSLYHWNAVASDFKKMLNGDLKNYIVAEMKNLRKYYNLLPNKNNVLIIVDWKVAVDQHKESHKKWEKELKEVNKRLNDIPDTQENKKARTKVDLELEAVDIKCWQEKYKIMEYRRKIDYVTGKSDTYEVPAHNYFSLSL